jgi:predicted component of type VI protein secretion system
MNKALFEKLTMAGEEVTLKQSVTANIERILSGNGLLDADTDIAVDAAKVALDSIYRRGLPYIVDQSSASEAQMQHYRAAICDVLMQFEPRLKSVSVQALTSRGLWSSCRLKIALMDGEFERDFAFSQ